MANIPQLVARTFGDLLNTLRTGEPAAQHHYGQPFFQWLAPQPEMVATFSRAMATIRTRSCAAPTWASSATS